MSLLLNPHPDAWGWIYGTYHPGNGEIIAINIMPPKAEWRGDTELEGHEPHETDFVIFADGKEVGRAQRLDDVVRLLAAP